MYEPADMTVYSGRVDAQDGTLGHRWHQIIRPLEPPYRTDTGEADRPSVVFLGFASDEGVRRNQGRVGAWQGPRVIKRALSNLPAPASLRLYDGGEVLGSENLEASQRELGEMIERILAAGHFPLVLGGGHEVAYGSYLGLRGLLSDRQASLGIVNFDAHFDLRKEHRATSGTPFSDIAEDMHRGAGRFRYFPIGISRCANTRFLFKRAEELNVSYVEDYEAVPERLGELCARVHRFAEDCTHLYVSVDADVLPAYAMPAVSAPAVPGVDFAVVSGLLRYLLSRHADKVSIVDIAEFSPRHDTDGLGERTIARLVFDIVDSVDSRGRTDARETAFGEE